MSNRYSLNHFTDTYEKLGITPEFQQVTLISQGIEIREVVRSHIHGHFDHESLLSDGRNYFLLLKPYNEENPVRTPRHPVDVAQVEV